ncbi:MAG: ROK family protein, partial [Alphaproteobacteria bacterium]|nr:ROK family protein [Alphaproteobacteria bacterium]
MRFGLDLGGTKMEAALLDDAGAIIWRERRPTPAENYDAILDVIAGLVAKAQDETGGTPSIGIAMPGSLSPKTGLVRNSN